MAHITQELIEAALERPDSFAYYGDLPLFENWGLCGPVLTRDSGPLEESNYETIREDLESNFGPDVEIVSSQHWLVGWCDQIAVRVTDENGDPTPAFERLIEWKDRLEEYPVADEMDYSRREREELIEAIEGWYWPGNFTEKDGTEYESDPPENYGEQVAEYLFDVHSICSVDELTQEMVDECFWAKGWWIEQDDIF